MFPTVGSYSKFLGTEKEVSRQIMSVLSDPANRKYLDSAEYFLKVSDLLARYPDTEEGEPAKVISLIAVRVFNLCATSIKLALHGYYQESYSQQRGLFEINLLLAYFHYCPDQIIVWRDSDKKVRRKLFAVGVLNRELNRIENLDPELPDSRNKQYERLSEYAAHMTYQSFRILNKDGHVRLGPYFIKKDLLNCMFELNRQLTAVLINLVNKMHKISDAAYQLLLQVPSAAEVIHIQISQVEWQKTLESKRL